jgi:hypothetical protein
MPSRQGLKMEMVRRGSPTPGSIIESNPPVAEVCHKHEKGINDFRNGLRSVFHMGNGEVRGKNGHRVAQDHIFFPVENPLLSRRQIVSTQETGAFLDILLPHGGGSAC